MGTPLAQALHQGVNLAFRPRNSTGSKFHRTGENPKSHEIEEAATLVAYTVEDGRKAEKTFFRCRCLHWISSCSE
jgi:hypothetical protein